MVQGSDYGEECPLSERRENAKRIINIWVDDMNNGRELYKWAIDIASRHLNKARDAEDIICNLLYNMMRIKKVMTFKYFVDDSKKPFEQDRLMFWLCANIHNLCKSYERPKYLSRQLNYMDFETDGRKKLFGKKFSERASKSTLDIFLKKEKAQKTRETLLQLSTKQQNLIYMHYFRGMKYKEIAEELNIPIGSVKSGLNQTKGKLREKLASLVN